MSESFTSYVDCSFAAMMISDVGKHHTHGDLRQSRSALASTTPGFAFHTRSCRSVGIIRLEEATGRSSRRQIRFAFRCRYCVHLNRFRAASVKSECDKRSRQVGCPIRSKSTSNYTRIREDGIADRHVSSLYLNVRLRGLKQVHGPYNKKQVSKQFII